MKITMKLATLIRKTREMAKPLAILGIRFNKIQFDKYFKKTIKQKNKHHCCFVFVSPWISDRSLIFPSQTLVWTFYMWNSIISLGSTLKFWSILLGGGGGCKGGARRHGFFDEFHSLALLDFESQLAQDNRAGPRAQFDVFTRQSSRRSLLTVRELASLHILLFHFTFAIRSADGYCTNSRWAWPTRNLRHFF